MFGFSSRRLGNGGAVTPEDSRQAIIEAIQADVAESAALQAVLDAANDPAQNNQATQDQAAQTAHETTQLAQAILDEHATHVATLQQMADEVAHIRKQIQALGGA